MNTLLLDQKAAEPQLVIVRVETGAPIVGRVAAHLFAHLVDRALEHQGLLAKPSYALCDGGALLAYFTVLDPARALPLILDEMRELGYADNTEVGLRDSNSDFFRVWVSKDATRQIDRLSPSARNPNRLSIMGGLAAWFAMLWIVLSPVGFLMIPLAPWVAALLSLISNVVLALLILLFLGAVNMQLKI